MSAFVALLRPFTLLAPTVGTLCTAGVAAAALDVPLPGWRLALAMLAAVLATGASNAWNQVFDAAIDGRNKPHRPIPSGRVSVGEAKGLGHALALAALVVAACVSVPFLACVGIGVLATWIYSAPPLRTKRSTWGALLTIAIPRGVLVPVAGWSVIASPTASDPWALGLVAGLNLLGAAATKDFADIEGDRIDDCRTLPVVHGARQASRIVAPFLVVPFLLYPPFGGLGWLAAPMTNLVVLSAGLVLAGGTTAFFLLRDPVGLASGRKGHPAWIGMYLTLLLSQVGTWLAYAL